MATWTPAMVNDATVKADVFVGPCPGAAVSPALAVDWPRARGPAVNPSKRESASAVRTPVFGSRRTAAAAREEMTAPPWPAGPPERATPVDWYWSLLAWASNGPAALSVAGTTGWLLAA